MNSHSLRLSFALVTLLTVPFAVQAAVPVPLHHPAPVALDRIRQNNPAVLPLGGNWKFSLTHGELTDAGFRSAGKRAATASSFQSGNPPTAALDKRGGGKWCASSEAMPQWWMVDMGGPQNISSLHIDWEFGDAVYNFKVEGSLNQTDWTLLSDQTQTTQSGSKSGALTFAPTSARWVRITVTSAKRADAYAWACFRNVEIKVRQNGQEVIWKPQAPLESPRARDAFAANGFGDQNWTSISVPSNWEMLGFSKPTYDQPDDAVGLYRRWVDVPARFAGQRVLWHFDGVFAGTEVFINGQLVATHDSGFTAFDVDVTKALKPGQRNLLALRVSKTTPSVDLDTGDYWSMGGVYRENYLLALPPTHISDVTVRTDLDAKYRDANLTAQIQVSGKAGAPIALSGVLLDNAGKKVSGVELKGQAKVGAGGVANVPLRTTVKLPRLWSAEKPNLYHLALTLTSGGKTVERVQERFGFREIEVRNGVLLFNGVPIKCTGVDHHEEWADRGHALDEAAWRRDLTLMKSFNVNAIRTSHYNPASRFLELCDEMGFYVLDEVPFCWANPNDPKLKEPFLQRARETLSRDKNHPAVLAWSLGNESGYGPDNEAVFNSVKASDPTRPAFISQAGYWNNPRLDFADFHYPSLSDMKRISGETKYPAIFTEQPHIFYGWHALQYDPGAKDLWGQVLARNWDFVWKYDHMVGSFVWEWQDQGIADKFPEKSDISEATGLRGDNNKGLVDSYRRPKPETWHLKMVYSPVAVDALEVEAKGKTYRVAIRNRYSFTNLAELSCRWQALSGGKTLAQGQMRVPGVPRALVTASFPVTPGADTLRLEFVHPDGRSVYATRLHVVGTSWPHPPATLSNAELALQDEPAQVKVRSAEMEIVLDKATGQIRSWRSGNQTLVTGGPILNLGEGRYTWGEHGAKNFLYSKGTPQLRNVNVETRKEADMVRLNVSGDVFLPESNETKGRLSYAFAISPRAQVNVSWKLDWTAPETNLWEAGLKFLLPTQMNRLSWSRTGQWTEYPANHIGATTGAVTSRDLSFRATKRDVRWATLGANAPSGNPVTSLGILQTEGPLHVRARSDKESILFLSSQVPPPYDFSTNLIPEMSLSLKPGQSLNGNFGLFVTAGK